MRRRGRGFTLMEAIAAIVVLALAVPPMLWSIRDAQVRRVGPVKVSQARWLATERLEDIIADRHSATRGYAYVAAASYPDEPLISGFTGFTRSVAVTETGPDLATPGAGYKTVTVTVGWIDGAGAARSLAVSTVLMQYS